MLDVLSVFQDNKAEEASNNEKGEHAPNQLRISVSAYCAIVNSEDVGDIQGDTPNEDGLAVVKHKFMSRIVSFGHVSVNGLILLACNWISLCPNLFMMQVDMLNRVNSEEEHSRSEKSNCLEDFLRTMDELMRSID